MKVLFVNDSTSNPNWGDRAATTSLRMMVCHLGGDIIKTITEDDLIRSSLDHHVASEDANDFNSREFIKLFIPPLFLKLRRRLLSNVDRTRGNLLIPCSWRDYEKSVETVLGKKTPWPELLQSFKDIDVAVINGLGSIYGNNTIPRTELFLSFLIKKHFNKPVIIVNHSADFDHPDLSGVAEEVYPLFDDVVFRDEISVERCKTLCRGRFAADTAFWFKPASRKTWAPLAGRLTYFDVWPDTASFDPSEPYLCVGGSSIFGHAGKRETIVSGYILLIKHLQSLYSGQIVLTASDMIDQMVFRPIAGRLKLPLIGLTTPVQQTVDILGNADAYVGGRWHASVFALRGGTPVLALSSKTFKMRALTEMAGLSSETFDALDLEHEMGSLGQQLLSYLEQGNGLRRRLCSWADEMAKNSWNNVAYLNGLQMRIGATKSAGS